MRLTLLDFGKISLLVASTGLVAYPNKIEPAAACPLGEAGDSGRDRRRNR